jgi:hypothetical protein
MLEMSGQKSLEYQNIIAHQRLALILDKIYKTFEVLLPSPENGI